MNRGTIITGEATGNHNDYFLTWDDFNSRGYPMSGEAWGGFNTTEIDGQTHITHVTYDTHGEIFTIVAPVN